MLQPPGTAAGAFRTQNNADASQEAAVLVKILYRATWVSLIDSFKVVARRVTPSRITSGDEYEKLMRMVLSFPPLG